MAYNFLVLTTLTYALYPTAEQESRLFHYLYVGRTLYNHSLAQRIAYYKETGKSLSYYEQQNDLTILRAGMQTMRDVPVWVERDALDRLDKAYDNFFRRVKNGAEKPGFPRFKGFRRWNSFVIANPGKVIKHGCKIYVSGIGLITGRNVRQFAGKAKTLCIKFRAGKWFAMVVADNGQQPPPIQPIKSAIGIDVGLNSFATMSNGDKIDNPRFYRALEKKLVKAQRNVSRKAKGSKNCGKAIRRLQRVHATIQNQRSNFTNHLSKKIVAEHQLIAVENLSISGMVKGRFGKSILDAAWGQFISQLRYKAENAGVLFCAVNPRGTSQECSKCGEIVLKDLSVRVHSCLKCGLVLDRDENAAKNILARSLIESAPRADGAMGNACGADVRPPSGGSRRRSRKPSIASCTQ